MEPNITLSRWQIVNKIGQGAFSEVYTFRNELTDRIVAAKISRTSDSREFKKEIGIHCALLHPNIVQFVNAFAIEKKAMMPNEYITPLNISLHTKIPYTLTMAILLEYCPGNSLSSLVEIKTRLNEQEIKLYTKQLVSALMYLKEQNVLHRDIKPDNVLLCSTAEGCNETTYCVKLSDFGLSEYASSIDRKGAGTPLYLAPEVLKTSIHSFQSEIWALGVTIFYIAVGKLPFDAKNLTMLRKVVEAGVLKFPEQPKLSANLEDLLKKMLVVEALQRMQIENVLAHPFFTEDSSSEEEEEPAMAYSPVKDKRKEFRAQVDWMRRLKTEFGLGSRDEFYLYIARQRGDQAPLPLNEFNKIYDKLYTYLPDYI